MKYLKLYEQYDFEDLSDDDLFGPISKGPYDNILKYGNNGPDFKCGDRVRLTNSWQNSIPGFGEISEGTIVDFEYPRLYLVCFDNYFRHGHTGARGGKFYNIPEKHGYWVDGYFLEGI